MEIAKTKSANKTEKISDLILDNFYGEGLVIKKYNIPENIMQEACREAVRESISDPRPIVYLDFGEEEYLLDKNNETEFYKIIVGKFIDSLFEDKNFKDSDSFNKIKTNYEKSFDSIYTGQYLVSDEYLSARNNLGSNLTKLIEMITPGRTKSIKILTNISLLPILPKGSVSTNKSEGLLTQEGKQLVNRVNFAYGTLSGLLIGGSTTLKQTIALPGWTIDILTNLWNNQQWGRALFAQSAVLEELAYKTIIEL